MYRGNAHGCDAQGLPILLPLYRILHPPPSAGDPFLLEWVKCERQVLQETSPGLCLDYFRCAPRPCQAPARPAISDSMHHNCSAFTAAGECVQGRGCGSLTRPAQGLTLDHIQSVD